MRARGFEGDVCVVGGYDGWQSHCSSETFCPVTTVVGPLPAGTRVLMQQLVAQPERNGKHARVSSFDAQNGQYVVEPVSDDEDDDGWWELSLPAQCVTSTGGEWRPVPAMGMKRISRDGCATVSVEGNHDDLYVVGGSRAFESELETAECYDSFSNEWRPLPNMNTARSVCGAVSVQKPDDDDDDDDDDNGDDDDDGEHDGEDVVIDCWDAY